ncbi:MAG: hypothetical protein H0T92_21080, partial [Pyrinomonadaceae bacterium]|nr:hypothetical protein [Pyrinomonadaceae bacterium]
MAPLATRLITITLVLSTFTGFVVPPAHNPVFIEVRAALRAPVRARAG